MNEQTALEEISYIKKIIDDSRKTVIDNGLGYIIWGVLILLGLLSTYYIIVSKIPMTVPWNWIILIGGGWAYTIFNIIKHRQKKSSSTFAQKILGSVWFSLGISATILGFLAPASGAVSGVFISALISVVLGMAYFISGVLYSEKWVSLVAIGWWVGAIVMFYLPGMHVFLIMSLMIILLQIIPGIILYSKFKKELAVK